MIELGSPWWLLLLVIPALRIVLRIVERRRGAAAIRYSSLSIVRHRVTWRARLAWLPLALETAGWVILIIALARPQRVATAADDRFGIDIAIVLDASGSMAAEDFRPRNRFVVARDLVAQFIERRVDDRIGIITFGARAATRVPVTFDRNIAKFALERSAIGENGDGTAIGHAIATAVNRLRVSDARSRVIILLTDGVNNAGSIEPAAAAGIAAKLGIRLYTIGVGSHGPVPIPVRVQDPLTGDVRTIYQMIRADLDETMLSQIAEGTGGRYFRAVDEESLGDILNTIDALETSRLDAPRRRTVEELYRMPLQLALLAALAGLLAGETVWMRLLA